MPIAFTAQGLLVQLVWESANFASGAGTTTLAFNAEATDAGAAAASVETIVTAWQTRLRPITDNEFTLDYVRWETQQFSGERSVAMAGQATINSPPPNTSLLVVYGAIRKGPRNRGRSYWPGLVSEGEIDERGVVLPARIATVQTAIGQFFADIDADPNIIDQAIAQSTYPGQSSPPQVPWPAVSTRGVSSLVATQRRRLRR